ncbi:Fc receptor-like protein 4 [Rhinophrynus dorsalis]
MINRVQQIFVIKSAQQEDTGDYQCETSSGDRSDAVRLTVSSDDVILQVPPDLHEGDSLSVRCHSKAGLLQRHLTFFKDELFSYPQVKVSPDLVTEGANMTVTCVTTLSPLRASTELRFTFYMNQHIVQESSPSNKYQVHSAQMEDSGNYSCDVRTSNNIIKKSKVTQIHIVESNRGVVVQNIVRLVLSACISLMTICLLFYHMKTQRTSKPQVKEGEVSACP